MPQTKREKIMIVVTALTVIIGVLFSQWENLGIANAFSSRSAEIDKLRKQQEEYLSILERRSKIQDQFANLEAPYSVKSGQTVDMSFNEQMYEICVRNRFSPQIDPPWVERIPNVEEYGLMFVSVNSTGTGENLVHLLKELDAKGFLVRKLTVDLVTDTPNVVVDFDVARPVRLDEVKPLLRKGRGGR